MNRFNTETNRSHKHLILPREGPIRCLNHRETDCYLGSGCLRVAGNGLNYNTDNELLIRSMPV